MTAYPRFYSHYDQPLWDSIAAHRMTLQRCTSCGTHRYPPGPNCAACLSLDYEWAPICGRGTLLSWTTFHKQYLPAYPAPTTVIAVLLEEGPILISNIDEAARPRLRLDAPVEMFYGAHPDGYALPRFRLAEAA